MSVSIINAIVSLNTGSNSFLGLKLDSEPASQSEYDAIDTWVVSVDENGSCVYGTRPTNAPQWSQVLAEKQRLQAEYEAKKYQRDRAEQYPTLQEQLDMQYWDSVNGTTTWQDAINAVKAKYPKGA
jgi:hypothetical protein